MGTINKEREQGDIEITPEILCKLQQAQLECLVELDRICRANGIEYSIDGGTLLGAVRHKGFIPWDDDIDVIMLRSEYERFFEVCKTQLDTERFFLQEHRTDRHYLVGYPRIRRNNTLYMRTGQEKFKHHNGIFIDLFVLDNVPETTLMRYIHRELRYWGRKILWSRTGRVVDAKRGARLGYRIISLIPRGIAFWIFDMLRRACARRKTELVCHYAMSYPNAENYPSNEFGAPADLLDDFTELEFEGHMFKAVADYDRYLTMLYSDYMTLPPEDKRKSFRHLSAFKGL